MCLCVVDTFLHLSDLLSQQAPVGSWFSLCSDPLLSLSLGSPALTPLFILPSSFGQTLNPPILLPPMHPAIHLPSYLTVHSSSIHPNVYPHSHPPASHPPPLYPLTYHLITLPHTHLLIHSPTVPPFHHPPTLPSVYISWFLQRAQIKTSSASPVPTLRAGLSIACSQLLTPHPSTGYHFCAPDI